MFNKTNKRVASLGGVAIAALLSLSLAVPASADSANPSGQWQSLGGEARYRVTLCGDGTQLCAKLTWLRSDARTAENLPYLNRFIINGADSTGANKWSGTVVYEGKNVNGSVTLVGANRLKVNGCRLVVCQSLEFKRM